MAAKASIQDEYLKKLIANRSAVRVVLTNGKDLRGFIKSCDAFTILLDVGSVELLVYKSAIAVLGPQSRANE
ncbi:MAG: RNA chaperone Hfq [Armatimonadia bacterium]